MGYVSYDYYKTIYGDSMPETDFNRLSWEACRRIDVLTLNKLKFAFPTNEDDIEIVRRCVCMIISDLYDTEQKKKADIESTGYTRQSDGSVRGKVLTSLSSGSESRGWSAGGTSTKTAASKMAEGETELSAEVAMKVKNLLAFVPDSNGVLLLCRALPYPVRNAPISRPPEIKPTPIEPPETETEPPTNPEETENPDSGEDNAQSEDIYFTDSVVVYNKYVNGLREETQYFGTRFDGVRIEFTQEENQNKAGKEDASVCLLKIKNDDTLPKPFKDPKSWEHLTTDEMLQYFTLDVDGDFFVIVKRKGLNLDVQAPVGVQDSNNAKYGGNFFEYMKQNYGYVYSMNSFEQFEGIPYFQVGGI